MNRHRKNVLVLATCQMLFGTARSILIATAPLIAYGIAAQKELATLPHSLVLVGTALATFPASMFMRRVGRRTGFIVGNLIGATGGAISTWAIVRADFWLFAAGALLFGLFAGFGQLYRFAAADSAPADYRSKAISLVLAGGVAAGFLGPELAKIGKDLIASTPFVGAYVLLVGTMLLSALVLFLLDIPNLSKTERQQGGRPLGVIMAQPVFIAATLTALIAQGVMNFLMTATPIAMHKEHLAFADTALVIEWHLVGMFAPGFITGSLIQRFGEVRMIFAGLLLELVCVVIALSGVGVFEFWLSMMLLGVGWNFAFTASSTLITASYTPVERNKTQGATNLIVYGFVSLLSLSSGAMIHYFGWTWVNLLSVPMLLIALGSTLWYMALVRRAQPVPVAE